MAAGLERAGFGCAWVTETVRDPFIVLALAAQEARTIELGTGVAIAFARSPMTLTQSAHDVHRLSGGRLLLRLGLQVRPHICSHTLMTPFCAGNYAMAGRAWDPRSLFAWPNSRSATMGADQAVKSPTQVRVASLKRQRQESGPGHLAATWTEVGEYFERTAHPMHLTSEVREDGLIDPADTRNTLGMALSACCAPPSSGRPVASCGSRSL